MKYVVGVDAGGTKTAALVCDIEGRAVGAGKAGPGNFQTIGAQSARAEVSRAVDLALRDAGLARADLASAFYGMAGADRPRDFAIIEGFLRDVIPGCPMGIENDGTIALKAATGDGVGVVAICGTGTKVIGFDPEGRRVQVGGLGYMFGDGAGADYIGMLAVRMATRGRDGRGRPTALYDMVCNELGLDVLDDLVERFYHDSRTPIDVAQLAPLVFEAAAKGDEVACSILREVGHELACSIAAALRELYPREGRVKIVLAGGVFANARDPVMTATLRAEILAEYPRARFVVFRDAPVSGAALYALEMAGARITRSLRGTLLRTCRVRLGARAPAPRDRRGPSLPRCEDGGAGDAVPRG